MSMAIRPTGAGYAGRTSPPGKTGFVGWWRPHRRGSWERICTAATERECWLQMLELRKGGDFMIRSGDRHPDETRAEVPQP